MHLPPEIGAYIQCFLKPTQPLFKTLVSRYPHKWNKLQADHKERLFRHYYETYHLHEIGSDVLLVGYIFTYKIKHLLISTEQLTLFKESKSYADQCKQLNLPFNLTLLLGQSSFVV